MANAPHWPDRVAECQLERPDGTLWVVESLDLEGLRVRVTARLEAGSAVRSRLEGVLLGGGDVVRWLTREGEVLWALRIPPGSAAPESRDAPGSGGGAGS